MTTYAGVKLGWVIQTFIPLPAWEHVPMEQLFALGSSTNGCRSTASTPTGLRLEVCQWHVHAANAAPHRLECIPHGCVSSSSIGSPASSVAANHRHCDSDRASNLTRVTTTPRSLNQPISLRRACSCRAESSTGKLRQSAGQRQARQHISIVGANPGPRRDRGCSFRLQQRCSGLRQEACRPS
jgi:hypothetical protein